MAARIRIVFDDDLGRSRVGVLFRLPLAILPALVLILWTAFASALLVLTWLIAVALGKVPETLDDVQHAYVRAWTWFVAWFTLAANGVEIDAPHVRQRRLTVALRPLLVLPSFVFASVLAVALAWTAFGAWFVALARGRTTEGLRELGAFCIRYQAETLAYLMLLTPCYPAVAPQTPQ